MYYVGAINRVGIEKELGDDDFYGQSYFVTRRGSSWASRAMRSSRS